MGRGPLLCWELAAHPAAVYRQYGACDIVARCGCQVDGGSGKILRLAPASSRDSLEDLAIPDRIGLQCLGIGRCEVTGSDGVHLDVVSCPLVCKCLGELCDSALGG